MITMVYHLRKQNFINNEQQIHIVYSNEMNGANILSNSHFNQQSTTKESLIRDGVAQASLTDGYLTGTNSNTTTNTQNVSGTSGTTTEQTSTSQAEANGNNTSNDEMKATNNSSQQDNGTTLEKTDLISQGNIGVTSSAQLLKEWREVLINMDKIIIDSCNDLFLKIY